MIEAPPAAPRTLNAGASRDLETICLKCLVKQPARRYRSARELAEDLGRFLNHDPILARPAPPWRAAAAWSRRHPWVFAAGASAVILVLLGVVYGLWAETRYLTWLAAHPGYLKAPGARTAWQIRQTSVAFQLVRFVMLILGFVGLPTLTLHFEECVPSSWGFDWRAPMLRMLKRVHPRVFAWATAFATLGAIGVAGSLYLVTTGVRAYVWEGYAAYGWDDLTVDYMLFFLGLASLAYLIQERRAIARGVRPVLTVEQLAPEERDRIRDAVLAGKRFEAVALYCDCTGSDRMLEALLEIDEFARRLNRE